MLTPQTAGHILGALSGTTQDAKTVEDARKIYVGASRAQRLLAMAVPKSQMQTLTRVLDATAHAVEVLNI